MITSNRIASHRVMTTNSSIGAVGPLKLVTVNTAPERAKRIVGRLCEEIKDSYLIDYVANTTGEEAFLEPDIRRGGLARDTRRAETNPWNRNRRRESHGRRTQARRSRKLQIRREMRCPLRSISC